MKADEPRQNRIPFMMSDTELAAIDDWRFENRIGTRAEAIRRLCQIAVAIEGPADRAAEVAKALVKIYSDALDRSPVDGEKLLTDIAEPAIELSTQSKFIKAAKDALRNGETLEEARLELQRLEERRREMLSAIETLGFKR